MLHINIGLFLLPGVGKQLEVGGELGQHAFLPRGRVSSERETKTH